MARSDLAALDATAQAALVRTGEVSPRELVEDAIARIDTFNPTLNAVITERFDRAMDDVRAVNTDAPFAGVPFLIKDLACTMAGEPSYDGMRAAKDAGYTASVDSNLARRYRDAGFIVL